MSQSALAKSPAEVAGVARRSGPSAAERFVRAAEQSWRPVALLLACFVAWWVISAAELVEPYLVPSPGATLDVLTGKASYLWQHSWVTTYET
ncbi:ABC transporter permease, partial [Streptomyces sp. NPDC005069]